jgi:hypothetical protein
MPPEEPKHFKKSKLEETCIRNLREIKRCKIQVITYMIFAIKD